MKPGDIVYELVVRDEPCLRKPVEVVSLEGDRATVKTPTGETRVVLACMLTEVPYLPGIEEELQGN
jgi:hypothetical protein